MFYISLEKYLDFFLLFKNLVLFITGGFVVVWLDCIIVLFNAFILLDYTDCGICLESQNTNETNKNKTL